MENVLRQLTSGEPQAIEGALRHLQHVNSMPEEAVPLLVALSKSQGRKMELVELLTSHPRDEFLDFYESLLREGSIGEKLLAIERWPLWSNIDASRKESLLSLIKQLALDETPIISLYANAAILRTSPPSHSCYKRIAEAIARGDGGELRTSIRSEARELFSQPEISIINEYLSEYGCEVMAPPNARPFPWEK